MSNRCQKGSERLSDLTSDFKVLAAITKNECGREREGGERVSWRVAAAARWSVRVPGDGHNPIWRFLLSSPYNTCTKNLDESTASFSQGISRCSSTSIPTPTSHIQYLPQYYRPLPGLSRLLLQIESRRPQPRLSAMKRPFA